MEAPPIDVRVGLVTALFSYAAFRPVVVRAVKSRIPLPPEHTHTLKLGI